MYLTRRTVALLMMMQRSVLHAIALYQRVVAPIQARVTVATAGN